MPDNTLELLIKLGYIGHEQAERAREDLAALGKQTTEAAASNKELGQSTEKSAEELSAFNAHGREFHTLIHEADRIVPGLGVALRAAFHPQNIGIAALVVAVEFIVHKLHESAEAAQKAREAMAATFGEQALADLKRHQEALDASSKSLEDYAEKATAAKDAIDALKEAEQTRDAVAKERAAQERDLLKAQEEQELAAAQTPEQKEAIRQKYAQRQTIAGDVSSEKEIEAQGADVRTRTGAAGGLASAADQAAKALSDFEKSTGFVRDKNVLDLSQKILEGLVKEKGELEGKTFGGGGTVKERLRLQELNDNAIPKQQEYVSQLEAIVKADQDRERALKQAADDAKAARDENTAAIKRETSLIERSVAVLQARLEGQEATFKATGQSGLAQIVDNLLKRLDIIDQQIKEIYPRLP